MKKILAIFLCLCTFISLVACKKDVKEDNNSNGDVQSTDSDSLTDDTDSASDSETLPEEEIPDPIQLSGDNKYGIVYSSGNKINGSNLLSGINSKDGNPQHDGGYYSATLEKEGEDFDGPMILLGNVDCEESENALATVRKYLDFSVAIEGDKILIVAHNSTRLKVAVEYFISRLSYKDGELYYVPEAKVYVGKYDGYKYPDFRIGDVDITEFSIVISKDAQEYETAFADELSAWFKENTGALIEIRDDSSERTPYEIILGSNVRGFNKDIEENKYSVKVESDGANTSLTVEFNNEKAKRSAMEMLTVIMKDGSIPSDTDYYNFVKEDPFIVSSIGRLRDPAIILVDGVYYAYGTRWHCFKNTSGKLDGEWEDLGVVVDIPEDAIDNYWAPEVHEYKGEYYMFTTYKSEASGHRGCVIMKSSTPEGPFKMITDGHITPKEWDAIDGTFYIDEEGQPWMVFVHEWTSTDDGIGRMAAAKLSDDLTRFISEPIELFRADDASWCVSQVTDGCWMYRCSTGELLMIWSSSDAHGYCVGIARSDNGKIDGNWTHDEKLLYSKSMTGEFDGGHGMIFKNISGQMYLSIHSPNSSSAGREETPIFVEIKEENGTLVWDK